MGVLMRCEVCKGSGKVIAQCLACHGAGQYSCCEGEQGDEAMLAEWHLGRMKTPLKGLIGLLEELEEYRKDTGISVAEIVDKLPARVGKIIGVLLTIGTAGLKKV